MRILRGPACSSRPALTPRWSDTQSAGHRRQICLHHAQERFRRAARTALAAFPLLQGPKPNAECSSKLLLRHAGALADGADIVRCEIDLADTPVEAASRNMRTHVVQAFDQAIKPTLFHGLLLACACALMSATNRIKICVCFGERLARSF